MSLKTKPPKKRKCKHCETKFTPLRHMMPFCSPMCEKIFRGQAPKKELKKQAHRELKEFNDSDMNILKRKAQKIFNEFIRLRDKNKPCVSCGYVGTGRQWHASHYKPATNQNLRFDERNVWKSCQICNTHLSGNLANYRLALIEKIGLEVVEELESTNAPRKWVKEELQDIIKKYTAKVKELKD